MCISLLIFSKLSWISKSYLWPCMLHTYGFLFLNFHKISTREQWWFLSLPNKRSTRGQGSLTPRRRLICEFNYKICTYYHHNFWTRVLHTYLKFITAWRQYGSWSLKFRGKCHQGASMPLRNCLRHTKCCCNFACARLAHENVNNGY